METFTTFAAAAALSVAPYLRQPGPTPHSFASVSPSIYLLPVLLPFTPEEIFDREIGRAAAAAAVS